MQRIAIAVVFAVACSGVLAARSQGQQQTPPPAPMQNQPLESTLVGCVIQGRTQGVYILDNAAPRDTVGKKGLQYRVVPTTEDLDLVHSVNKKVMVTGIAEMKTAPSRPAGAPVDEKDLPAFSAKKLTVVADSCSASGR